MGHLVNPVGFHVGYFSNWSDIWSVSNNLIYAEVLHNTMDFRRVMAWLFENFITDQYSILYSHFTIESFDIDKLWFKMYFYDGIVEQKILHLTQQLHKLKLKKLRAHRRILRSFRKIRPIKSLRVDFLHTWRYYDYMAARRIVFFFIYFLNLGRPSMSKDSRANLVWQFYRVFDQKWWHFLETRPFAPISTFIKYYVKFLVAKGFDEDSSMSNRLHTKGITSDFSGFFKLLDKTLYFWRSRQDLFDSSIRSKKISLKLNYKRFLNLAEGVNRFCTTLFKSFYYLYLFNFRQAKFFRFMSFIVKPLFAKLAVLDTKIEFFGLDNNSVSASFLARYVARKIEMRFQVWELFAPIRREMKRLIKNTSTVVGFKLQFVGRLTRRGGVQTTWVLGGSMPVSKMSAQIEHSFHLGILRNGISCVRVWIYRHKSFGNYNYNFLYRVKVSE